MPADEIRKSRKHHVGRCRRDDDPSLWTHLSVQCLRHRVRCFAHGDHRHTSVRGNWKQVLSDAQHAPRVLHVALECFVDADLAQGMQKNCTELLAHLTRLRILSDISHRLGDYSGSTLGSHSRIALCIRSSLFSKKCPAPSTKTTFLGSAASAKTCSSFSFGLNSSRLPLMNSLGFAHSL